MKTVEQELILRQINMLRMLKPYVNSDTVKAREFKVICNLLIDKGLTKEQILKVI